MTEIKSSKFYQSLRFPAIVLLILWLIQIIQGLTGLSFGWLGVYPRHIAGIKGIFTSPFIHSLDWMHLINNSVPLFVGLAMISFFFHRIAKQVIFLIYFLTGLGVWIFGRSVLHIGASGVVYGLISFIFWSGIFRRNTQSIILALIILLLYSGMFYGVLPNQPGISWESHLIGGLIGILVSYMFRQVVVEDEAEIPDPVIQIEDEDQDYFLDRTTFNQTKEERRQGTSDWFSDSTF